MNKFMSFLKRHSKKLNLFVGVVAAVAVTSAVVMAGFGPDRPTKVYNGPGTPGFDTVTFNSFTNVPNIGDERNFLTGKIAGEPGGFYDPMTKLRNDDEVLMRVYVHNNADPKYNDSGQGIAKNTRVKVELPDPNQSAQNLSSKAYISADNAVPQTIFDTLDMKAENGGFFGVQYVPGSTTVTDNGGTQALPDGIAGGGVNLGDVKGCFEYVKLVTFKVKVKMPRYSIAKSVRIKGQTANDWTENTTVKAGQQAEWRIEFKNLGTTPLTKVNIVDELPVGLNVVPNTVEVVNTNNPNGYKFPTNAVQANGRQINVQIGDYQPGSNAFVYFFTTSEPECQTRTLTNTAYATPQGYGAVVDDAKLTVEGKQCEVKQPVYECTGLTANALGSNKYRFVTTVKTENGATVNKYIYNFGDNSEENNTTANTVEHQYPGPGEYTAKVRVIFNVNNEQKEVSDARCEVKVNIPKDVCPYNPNLPKDSPDCGPCEYNPNLPKGDKNCVPPTTPNNPSTPVTEIPNTGTAGIAAGIFGTSATAYGFYAFVESRRALKNLK